MKKRRAKRIQSAIDIDLQVGKVVSDSEKLKTEALLNLITKIIFDRTLKEFYSNDQPPE